MQPFDPRAIANEILAKARPKHSVTPLALQKLIYFAHGRCLSSGHGPLVAGVFEAWQRGPVLAPLYHQFKHYGRDPITGWAERTDLVTGEITIPRAMGVPIVEQLVDRIVADYGVLSAGQLVRISHARNGPWDRVVKKHSQQLGHGLRISNEDIVQYFGFHKLSVSSLVDSDDDGEDAPIERYGLRP